MKWRVVIISLICGVVIWGGWVAWRIYTQPKDDAARFEEFRAFGRVHHGAWQGRPMLTERIVAFVHSAKPSDYYNARYEQQRQALEDSGYFVRTNFPAPGLRSNLYQALGVLTNASIKSGIYAQWGLEHHRDRITILCRPQDIPFWQSNLAQFAKSADPTNHE